MKKSILILIPLLIILTGFSDDKPKYIRGDCITPIDPWYSWFSEFAKVEFYTSIDGISGKKYILVFPNYQSNSVVFSKSIEEKTKKVDKYLCNIWWEEEGNVTKTETYKDGGLVNP